jgi:hypothetical protein
MLIRGKPSNLLPEMVDMETFNQLISQSSLSNTIAPYLIRDEAPNGIDPRHPHVIPPLMMADSHEFTPRNETLLRTQMLRILAIAFSLGTVDEPMWACHKYQPRQNGPQGTRPPSAAYVEFNTSPSDPLFRPSPPPTNRQAFLSFWGPKLSQVYKAAFSKNSSLLLLRAPPSIDERLRFSASSLPLTCTVDDHPSGLAPAIRDDRDNPEIEHDEERVSLRARYSAPDQSRNRPFSPLE